MNHPIYEAVVELIQVAKKPVTWPFFIFLLTMAVVVYGSKPLMQPYRHDRFCRRIGDLFPRWVIDYGNWSLKHTGLE